MNKKLLVYIFLICIILGGVYFFQENQAEKNTDTVKETVIVESVKNNEKKQNTNKILQSSSQEINILDEDSTDTTFREEKPEPRFEEILYPDEYDFKSLRTGPVYAKAGTKIKADFSYMLDKKLGDEVTLHFPNASVTGEIVKYEIGNGPEGIVSYDIYINVNNSRTEGGSMPERIFLGILEQNGKIYSADGSFETPNANGLFILENGIGYFTTKEDYGNTVMELGIKTD